MAGEKKSFIMYKDTIDIIDKLSDEQAGSLFRAICNFQRGIDQELDTLTEVAFSGFECQFIRDDEKWQTASKKNSKNGAEGAKKREKNRSERMNTEVKSSERMNYVENSSETQPNHAVTVTVTDTVTVTGTDTEKKKEVTKAFGWEWAGISKDQISHLKEIRSKKKHVNSPAALAMVKKQVLRCGDSGYPPQQVIGIMLENGWAKIDVKWLKEQGYAPDNRQAIQVAQVNQGASQGDYQTGVSNNTQEQLRRMKTLFSSVKT